MRFNVDRICELAGLESKSGNLMTEIAVTPAPATKDSSVKIAEIDDAMGMDEFDDMGLDMGDDTYNLDGGADYDDMLDIDDEAVYEIDEMQLMEALVDMRQTRLEETSIRDAVREEIARALSDKSSSWMYGSNKPTASRQGQIARGGFGVGFGFKR
jgi:hypothetical protein